MNQYTIIIKKSGIKIGAVNEEYHFFETYEVLNDVKRIIDNYNKNLSCANLSDPLIIHRLLEAKPIDVPKTSCWYEVLPDTDYYLSNIKSSIYYPPVTDQSSNWGTIGITEGDMELLCNDSTYNVIVDMDKKYVAPLNLIKINHLDYRYNGIEGYTFDVDINPFMFSFNELDDVIEIMKKKCVWRYKEKDLLFQNLRVE